MGPPPLEDELPVPEGQQEAPWWPNAFSDGSVVGSAVHGFSQAGAAVIARAGCDWHPAAAEWADSEGVGGYEARYAHLHGNVSSSTRAEVAA
eukprot:12209165-Alexandrium_andersonii.AAC.1